MAESPNGEYGIKLLTAPVVRADIAHSRLRRIPTSEFLPVEGSHVLYSIHPPITSLPVPLQPSAAISELRKALTSQVPSERPNGCDHSH